MKKSTYTGNIYWRIL